MWFFFLLHGNRTDLLVSAHALPPCPNLPFSLVLHRQADSHAETFSPALKVVSARCLSLSNQHTGVTVGKSWRLMVSLKHTEHLLMYLGHMWVPVSIKAGTEEGNKHRVKNTPMAGTHMPASPDTWVYAPIHCPTTQPASIRSHARTQTLFLLVCRWSPQSSTSCSVTVYSDWVVLEIRTESHDYSRLLLPV